MNMLGFRTVGAFLLTPAHLCLSAQLQQFSVGRMIWKNNWGEQYKKNCVLQMERLSI